MVGGESQSRHDPLFLPLIRDVDNPESDIAGANAYGWNSILLKTGVYQSGKPKHEPTVISADVEEGVMWAIERELNER